MGYPLLKYGRLIKIQYTEQLCFPDGENPAGWNPARLRVATWLGVPYKRTAFWWLPFALLLNRLLKKMQAQKPRLRFGGYKVPESLLDEPVAYYITLERLLLANSALMQRLNLEEDATPEKHRQQLKAIAEAIAICCYRCVYVLGWPFTDWRNNERTRQSAQKAVLRLAPGHALGLWRHVNEQLRAASERIADGNKGAGKGPKPMYGMLSAVFGAVDGPDRAYRLLESEMPLHLLLAWMQDANHRNEYHNRQMQQR